jgi:acetyl esterase/lipase
MEAPADAALIERGAQGDAAALSALALHCVRLQYAGVSAFESLIAAEAFARLAAAGGSAGANMLLAGVLRIRAGHVAELGDLERAIVLLGQSEALCEAFPDPGLSEGLEILAGVLTAYADLGDDLASVRLQRLFEALSPASADSLRRTLNRACADDNKSERAVA